MDSTPSNNTAAELEFNDKLCVSCENLNCLSRYQKFRLFLPRLINQKVTTIIEIPFFLSRKFAIGVEDFYENSLQMRLRYMGEPSKLSFQLSMTQAPRFLVISTDNQRPNKIISAGKIAELKDRYILNNRSVSNDDVVVGIFHKTFASKRDIDLINNCRALLDIECAWLVRLVGCVDLPVENLFVNLMEHYSTNLCSLIQKIHQRKDSINLEIISDLALFITAEFFVAVDSLHERSLIHRFLTPESVYFDMRGHLKLGGALDSLNADRMLMGINENPDLSYIDQFELSEKLHKNYLDPEVHYYLMNCEYLEAFYQLDCLADVFSMGIIIIETLSNINFLTFKSSSVIKEPIEFDRTSAVSFYLNPDNERNLERKLTEHCGFVSRGFYYLILLMLQPKRNRMRGLRMNVQRHRYSQKSGCEYKLRLELVARHPAFEELELDSIIMRNSPVLQMLDIVTSSCECSYK